MKPLPRIFFPTLIAAIACCAIYEHFLAFYALILLAYAILIFL